MIRCPVCGFKSPLEISEVTFDAHANTITCRGRTITVDPKQIDLLEHLIDAYPHPLRLDTLARFMYGSEAPNELQRVRVQIGLLRRALARGGMDIAIQANQNEHHNRLWNYSLAPSELVA